MQLQKWRLHVPWESHYGNTSTKTANLHIKDNDKLHIWPNPASMLYLQQVPGASLKIEGILFQELLTKIDENQW